MRWSVVRLIAGKESRDLLRDRRSVILTVLMPIVLYPLFGLTAWGFASSLLGQPTVIGVVGIRNLAIPEGQQPPLPPLLDPTNSRFAAGGGDGEREVNPLVVQPMDGEAAELLKSKAADAVVVVPEGFGAALERGEKPQLETLSRDGDDKSKLASKRLNDALRAWEGQLRKVRFERAKLPADFEKQFSILDPQTQRPPEKKAADELRDLFARIFPFILTMWIVAGATQPAVDLTAGEKERGTMETLLISPANRSEIVLGKFFAVTLFSFGAAAWNAVWLTASGIALERILGFPILNLPGMLGCIALNVPTAMLFAAVSVAFGVFARSTKEGQYYLIPMMLLVMPLAFSSMMPGTELTPGTCFIPVTGSLLLQQRMLSVTGEPIPWNYFLPVFGSLALYVGLGLALAVWQFNRESVLFRETGPTRKRGWFGRS
jgi:sodium transport system permease protein